ncbi:MAG: magnesium transporter CorA family protein [Promethearchaeota archaeon]
MKFAYYILKEVVQNRPKIEQFEVSLEDLGERFNPDEVKLSCKCCFLDVNLEPQEILDYDQNQEILDLLTVLDISLDTFEEIIEDSRPRLDDYGDYMFILFKSVEKHPTDVEGKREYQCGLIVYENVVISIHTGVPIELNRLFQMFSRYPKMLIEGEITYLISHYIDTLIDPTYGVLDGWRKVSDDIEWRILSDRTVEQKILLEKLIGVRESLFDIVKILQANREVVNRMKSVKFPQINDDYIPPELDDHIKHLLDESDILRFVISDLMNLYFNAESNKLNKILARFTFVTSILLLPSLIGDIFGMNNTPFPNIPFWSVLLIMAASMVVVWGIFKKFKLI